MPFELRPYPVPTLRPEDDYLQNAWRNSVYPLARRMGVDIRLPDVSPQPYTRLAFEGLEFSKEHGKAGEYNSAVMRAFFQKSLDIGDLNVLVDIASAVGLDGPGFRRALEGGEYTERTAALLRHAREDIGLTGVPFFLIGTRALTGLQSAASLRVALDQFTGTFPSP